MHVLGLLAAEYAEPVERRKEKITSSFLTHPLGTMALIIVRFVFFSVSPQALPVVIGGVILEN